MKKLISIFLAFALLFGLVTPAFAASDLTHPFRPSDIPTGLVGYWKFDNNANDSSSGGHNLSNGTAYPAYVQTDYWKSGEYSADFEAGSSQYLTGGDIHDMNGKSFSVAVQVKPETVSSTMLWVSKGNMGASGWGFGITADGVNLWVNDQVTLYGTLPTNGRSEFYVATYNSGTGIVCIYKDGNLVKTAANTGTISGNATGFIVGANNGGASGFWDGLIKDVAVWEAVLTPQQVKSLSSGIDLANYTYRPSDVSTQPTHWWKLNEVSGNRADSVSTNPLTLTDNNTVLSSGGYVEGVGATFVLANSEYLSSTTMTDFQFGTSDFTLRTRIKPGASAATQTLFGIGSYAAGIDLQLSASGTITLYMNGGGPKMTRTTAYSEGVWSDIVLRRSGTNLTLWVDGIQQGVTVTDSTNLTPGDDFKLGYIPTSGGYYLGGMEDVAVWKGYALTDAEIKSLAAGMPIQQQGIVMYSKQNAASGNETTEIGAFTMTENGTCASETGKVGGARGYDATGDHLDIADGASWTFADSYFCGAWVKPATGFDGVSGGTFVDIQRGIDSTGTAISIGGDLRNQYNSGVEVKAYTFSAGSWYHIFLNSEGTGTSPMSLWVNGVKQGANYGTAFTIDGSVGYRLGQSLYATGYRLVGATDEAMVWNRYARPEEIKAAYLKGLNGKEVTSSEKQPSSSGSSHNWFFFF